MQRILHISDIHFGPPHQRAASDALVGLVGERRPDLVVISGDLTQRAKPPQFRQARQFVDRIEELGFPTVTVPGNHDVPLYRFWERLFAPFGAYAKNFSPELEPTFRNEELFVVGVNSAHGLTLTEGRIGAARLRRLERQFAEAPAGLFKIAVIHHHLLPPPRFDRQEVLTNAAESVEVLGRAGVDVVLSGHYHQAYFGYTDELYGTEAPPVLVLSSGTSSSDRGRAAEHGICSCFWLEVDDSIRVSHLRRRGEGFSEFARHEFPRHEFPRREPGHPDGK